MTAFHRNPPGPNTLSLLRGGKGATNKANRRATCHKTSVVYRDSPQHNLWSSQSHLLQLLPTPCLQRASRQQGSQPLTSDSHRGLLGREVIWDRHHLDHTLWVATP